MVTVSLRPYHKGLTLEAHIWIDGGPVMLPGGYSSIGIMSDKGSKAVVDCVIVTDEDGFRPPMDEGGLKKLRAENTKE